LLFAYLLAACAAAPPPAPPATPSVPPPTPTAAPRAISVTLDITYTVALQPNVSAQALDIYAPVEAKAWPAVVFAHGFGERKQDYRRIMQAIAEQGALVFAADWPDRATDTDNSGRAYREVAETLLCAVRFARSRMAALGSPSLTFFGFSAGASAGALVALAGDSLERAWNDAAAARGGPPAQVKCAANAGTAQVDAFLGVAGPYNLGAALQASDPLLWPLVSPFAHLSDNRALRVRLLHGTFDSRVPIEQSMQFDQALRQAGYDSQLIRFDSGHAVPMPLAVDELAKLWQ
jgi:predicted esterase